MNRLEHCPYVFMSYSGKRCCGTAMHYNLQRPNYSDLKSSNCQRMLKPIQFTVLEQNYNFQMLTIQIRFYNSKAKVLVHILILSCFAFYFAFVKKKEKRFCISHVLHLEENNAIKY